MRLLLDTHVLLWASSSPERLGASAALVTGSDQRLLSAVCTWELAIKQGIGKLDLGADVLTWSARTARALKTTRLPISLEHTAAVERLPPVHRDPFDRLLVAQAQVEGVLLLTADEVLLDYGEMVRLVG